MLGRLKFDIQPLVNEMLDQLPSTVWESETTTFFDPALGGGQFVAEIERRLRAHGHSEANISQRVFGAEERKMRLNFALQKHILKGKYVVGGVDLDSVEAFGVKKFDVIVGNPPFQTGGETGGKSSLWRKFVRRGWDLLDKNGYILMVAPRLPQSSNDLGDIFTQYQTLIVWTNVQKHFKGIGSSFYAWLVKKTPHQSDTFFIDENLYVTLDGSPLPKDIKAINILKKFYNTNDFFKCLSSPEYYHTSVASGKDEEHLSASIKHPYLIRRTSGNNYSMYGSVEPTDYYTRKVTLTFSGNPHFKYHNENDPIGTIKFQSGYIKVKDAKEAENLISLYNSKLYRYVRDQISTGGMRGNTIYEQPYLDISRKWSDQEIYAEFNLTQEEIDLIEKAIK
jgi:type I restriction-modification system DNA methylase subunit